MDANVLRLELDRWGKRVFFSSLLLLVALQTYVWFSEGQGFQLPVLVGSRDSLAGGAQDTVGVVQVKMDRPVALLAGPEVFALDASGESVPLEQLPGPKDLPVITGVDPADRGTLQTALGALDRLRRSHYALYGRISELHYTDGAGWIAYLVGNALPVVLGPDSLKERLVLLARALPVLEKQEDLSRVERLDLRFASQLVVRYREPGLP